MKIAVSDWHLAAAIIIILPVLKQAEVGHCPVLYTKKLACHTEPYIAYTEHTYML